MFVAYGYSAAEPPSLDHEQRLDHTSDIVLHKTPRESITLELWDQYQAPDRQKRDLGQPTTIDRVCDPQAW
jgi:hypothetical protein